MKYELLCCPSCRNDLCIFRFTDESSEIMEGILVCDCGVWYPISNGIPRLFVPEPSRPDDRCFVAQWQKELSKHIDCDQYSRSSEHAKIPQVQAAFHYKWTRQSSWGLEGKSAEVMEKWLLPRYGWASRKAYSQFMRKKKVMLDAGCGLGREAIRMAQANPEAVVVGLELSGCVDEAVQHARKRGVNNILFIQADLTRPPIKEQSIDFIISEGVLHHTPNTRDAFHSLVPLLSSGGEIGIYVYRKKAPLREYADDYVRGLIKDMPPEKAWKTMESLTRLGQSLSRLKVNVEVQEDVPVLGIKAGKYDIQRLIYYSMFKCYWNDQVTFDENVHVNFDWYYPKYAWRHTDEEVRTWLKEAGLTAVHWNTEEAGITLRATR